MCDRYTRRNYEDESSITDACSTPYNLQLSVHAAPGTAFRRAIEGDIRTT